MVFKNGQRLQIGPLTIFAIPSSEPKVAFIVPKTVGKAVVRNRIRRRLSEMVRLNRAIFNNYHLIFRVDEDTLPADACGLQDLVERLVKRLERCRES